MDGAILVADLVETRAGRAESARRVAIVTLVTGSAGSNGIVLYCLAVLWSIGSVWVECRVTIWVTKKCERESREWLACRDRASADLGPLITRANQFIMPNSRSRSINFWSV